MFFLLFFLLAFSAKAKAEADPPARPEALKPTSLLIQFQYGWPHQYVSELPYNAQVVGLGIALEKECGLWPFWGNKKLEQSLLLEFRFSRIRGNNIELSNDQVSKEVLEQAQKEGHRPRTDWDHYYQVGLIPYYRLYYPLNREIRVYGEAGLGFTFLNEPLIEDGTRWNFLLTGGLGLDWRIKEIPFYTFLRFEHFSNGGKLWGSGGLTTARVIGLETMALGVGLRFPLNW